MFNIKYKIFNPMYVLDDTLITLLNNEAKKGWFLKKINSCFIKFKREDIKDVKYMLDYIIPNEEYKEILQQQGYVYVDHLQYLYIYKNENLNCEELHTDIQTKYQAIKKWLVPNRQLILNILSIFLLFILFYSLCSEVFMLPFVLGSIYSHLKVYSISLFFVIFIILSIINLIFHCSIKIHINKILNDEEDILNICHIINKLSYYLSIAMIILSIIPMIIIFISNPLIIFYLILFELIYIPYVYFINKHIYKIEEEYKRKLVTILGVILFFIAHFYIINMDFSKKNNFIDLNIKPSMNDISFTISNNNLITTQYSWFGNEDNNNHFMDYEDYSLCLNNYVAKKIFESEIINLDRYSKNYNNVDYLLFEKHNIYREDENMTFHSYNDIITTYKVYNHPNVDKCYYNDMFAFMLKDNKVVITYTKDNIEHINNIIEHYFK